MNHPQETPSLSLSEEQGELTRSRIKKAAMQVVAQRGFHATVDEIARVSGVSPRTIFRHYATQSGLIVATVKDMFDAIGRRPIDGMPAPNDDLGGWLEVLSITIHRRNAEIIGNAFWDLHAPELEESGALTEVATLRRAQRQSGVRHVTAVAWRAAGGDGEPPADLESAFALNFSTFATQALMIDFDQTPEQIGKLTADILVTLVRRAVATGQGSEG